MQPNPDFTLTLTQNSPSPKIYPNPYSTLILILPQPQMHPYPNSTLALTQNSL